jgi:3-hydroxyisobutyrate dehydrogenase
VLEVKRVGFIGLGQMGLPMANHLRKGGYEVAGFDLTEEARSAFDRSDGHAVNSLEAAIGNADVIVTMLPNGKAVQSALLTNDAFRRAPKGALLIEMSSSAPTETQALAAAVAGQLRVVDAPVSGGVKRAVEGALTVMAGGDPADIDTAEPILATLSTKMFRCGPVGAGHAMKAINNYVSGAGVIAAIEGVQLGTAFGLDGQTIVDVLNASTGKNNATEVKMKQFILSKSFASGFAMGLMAKDIRTAATLSENLGLVQPGLIHTADLWDAASRALGGSVDHTRLFEYLAQVRTIASE